MFENLALTWLAVQVGLEPQEPACKQSVEGAFESDDKARPEPNGLHHISSCGNHDSLDSAIQRTTGSKVSCMKDESL